MTRLLCLLILLLPAPALAEDDTRGLSLMERGAQMLMEGLLQEIEPGMDALGDLAGDLGPALRDFSRQMGPALRGLLAEVEDWSAYHPPQMLENGDIILRRKTPPPSEGPSEDPSEDPPQQALPEDQIEL